MSLIKGTITIIYEKATLYNWFNKKIHELNGTGNESQYNEYKNKKNMIVSFNLDDKEYIYDLIEKNIVFEKNKYDLVFSDSYNSCVPLYIEIINSKTFFNYNENEEIKEKLKIIYSNNIRNETDMSLYNCIFSIDIVNIVFLIRKLKHGIDTHRYIFSYDPNYLTPAQIEILLYYIFLKDI